MGVTEETKIIVLNILHDVLPFLNEKDSRILEGSAAKHLGHGGIAEISKNFQVSRNTISSGIKTIETEKPSETSSKNTKNRIRKEGGGRKKDN